MILKVVKMDSGVLLELGTDAGDVRIQTPSLPLQWDVKVKTFDNGQACCLPLGLKDARAFSKWLEAFDGRLRTLVEGSKADWGGVGKVDPPRLVRDPDAKYTPVFAPRLKATDTIQTPIYGPDRKRIDAAKAL